MKIVILKGSPRKSGNSNLLAEAFKAGAAEAGHEVYEFDYTRQRVGGCLGCGVCKMNGSCVQKDDFGAIRDKLVEADMIVFATPIYYFGMSGQLKNVIDRFYSVHNCMGRKKHAHCNDGQPQRASGRPCGVDVWQDDGLSRLGGLRAAYSR